MVGCRSHTASLASPVSNSPVQLSSLQITTPGLPSGQIPASYHVTVGATGGIEPYRWSVVSGSLPPGLALGTSTGTVIGTPTGSGQYSFSVQVKDSATSPQTATNTFTLSIAAAALQITTSALADGTVQVPYSVTLAAKGGTTPYSWSVVSGSLPTGLALSSGGVISGIPSTANTYTFTVSATDSSVPSGSTTAQLSLTVMTSSVGEIPSTLFGMHKNAIISQPWPSVSVGAEGKGTAVTWGWIESTRGVYDWTQLDNYFNAAQAHGISFSFSNDSVPQWAVASAYNNTNNCSSGRCNAMVANIADWDAFITAMVNRYKNRGVQMIYELWNEPSLWDFDIGASPQTNYNDMVTLTTHMHDLIRSLDPNAMILAPSGVGTAYMDNYFTSGGTKDVDAVTYHAYYANAEDFIPYAQNYRIHMSTWGLSNKPLWDTEGSWGTSNLTSDQQVAFVARWYLLHWSQNVYRMYWYQWDNPTYGQLWDSTSGIHPSGIAYGQVENWMVGATMSTPCSANGTVWTCGFTRPGGYQALAVWDTSGASTYIPASQYTKSRDLSGNTSTITGGSISIGIKPILLE
jgi:hypothetical protein